MTAVSDPSAAPRRRRRPDLVLLRQIDADTPVHRLWAGTKLLAAAALSIAVSSVPTWPMVAVATGLLVVASIVGRVPWSALPRLPVWFWLAVLAGAVLTLVSGGRPEVAIAGAHVGLGNLESYALFAAVSFVLVGAGLVIGWTTPLGEVGPAVSRILRPLRWARVPTDEWAAAITLCLRSLPLLMDEIRTLLAARRIRPSSAQRGLHGRLDGVNDVLVAALVVSLRRAAEMGEAMTARGGCGVLTGVSAGPRWRDAVAGVVVAAACTAGWVLSH